MHHLLAVKIETFLKENEGEPIWLLNVLFDIDVGFPNVLSVMNTFLAWLALMSLLMSCTVVCLYIYGRISKRVIDSVKLVRGVLKLNDGISGQ